MSFIIEADGGSRGNPGQAGSGAVIIEASSGDVILELSRYIGVATNNVAEYVALEAALTELLRIHPGAVVEVRMDSKLVIEQMAGRWKIKHPDMLSLAARVQKLARNFSITWNWIPRELNSRADALANRAMDEKLDYTGQPANSLSNGDYQTPTSEHSVSRPSSIRAPKAPNVRPTTIYLVRHGRTELTESRRISGSSGADPKLSATGREDARKAAKAVAEIGISGQFAHLPTPARIVSSPIRRTRETAAHLVDQAELPLEIYDEFAEISFGDWDGLTNEEVFEQFPKEYEAWRGSWSVAPPNGESLADFDARVGRGLVRLLQQHEGESIVLVSHVMPIRSVLKKSLSGAPETYWRVAIAPCSITIVRFWGPEHAEVVAVNSTSHLI